jgi:hypothetical protein
MDKLPIINNQNIICYVNTIIKYKDNKTTIIYN